MARTRVELETALPEERLPMAVEAAAYFAVSEALTNVARYAQAARAHVRVEERDGHLDGTLEIDSRPGHGTQLRARLPSRGRRPVDRLAAPRLRSARSSSPS